MTHREPPDPPFEPLSDAMEYLGSYETIEAYLRAMLEPEVTPGCAWILECLDYAEVRRRWEVGGHRLVLERGHVYRQGGGLVPP